MANVPKNQAGVLAKLTEILIHRLGEGIPDLHAEDRLSKFFSDSPSKHAFVHTIADTFNITVHDDRVEPIQTFGELADLLLAAAHAEKGGHRYFIAFRTADGKLIETHIYAKDHREASERAQTRGATEIMTVARDDENSSDPRAHKIRTAKTGCLIPLRVAILAGLAVVGLVWLRKH